MPYTFKTLTLCSVILPILAITLGIIGCSAENPICSTNFCAVGEVFPRSDLDANTAFSEVDIDDSVIFATLVGTPAPVETTPAEPLVADDVTLADIVNDVATNGVNSSYKDQTVTIVAPVKIKIDATEDFNTGISLFTYNESVDFFVVDDEGVDNLAIVNPDTSYTFTVEIYKIQRDPDNLTNLEIWSESIQRPIKHDADILDITMNQLVASAATGGQTYVGKTVKMNATVQFDNAQLGNQGGISLKTNSLNVVFFVVDILNPEKLNRYRSGSTYQFVLHIQSIKPTKDKTNEYTIFSGIAND